ncbi:MAG: epoxyqueuosine reductase QueH [Anaerovoracaceae bacterium]|nr:epoxyqueuosine reductase QueH [Bacillota bacterium]MDY2670094.1 epoxyqueuosine reductase QueH [Anaerovoracaceae bacterium]
MDNRDSGEKRGIFLHSCCGPCSTAVIERLVPRYRVTVFFYNPNITNEGEYEKRLANEKKFIEEYNKTLAPEDKVTLIEGPYDPENYLRYVSGWEDEPENGPRCTQCFRIRMDMTARFAVKNGFDLFTTTLSVSPHKSTPRIVETGREISKKYGIDFLDESFKKKDGFHRSVELSKEYGLYRQNYCGCIFSERPGAGPEDPSKERKLRR